MAERKCDWTPVEKGDVYCSPSCGLGCKKADYEKAKLASDALVVVMGEGWEAQVWENFGWNYQVKKGVATIHYDKRGGSYTVYFNSAKQVVMHANHPRIALACARAKAKRIADELLKDIGDVRDG